MNLHNRIMNLQVPPPRRACECSSKESAAYRIGHRDARHAAAELANEYQAVVVVPLVEACELLLNAMSLAGWEGDLAAIRGREAIARAKGAES